MFIHPLTLCGKNTFARARNVRTDAGHGQMARTQKNKATSAHLGMLKVRIKRRRDIYISFLLLFFSFPQVVFPVASSRTLARIASAFLESGALSSEVACPPDFTCIVTDTLTLQYILPPTTYPETRTRHPPVETGKVAAGVVDTGGWRRGQAGRL